MRNYATLCILVGLIFLAACRSRPPAEVRHVSLGIFEVVECPTGSSAAMNLEGSNEKYCLAAKPVVDETDIRLARTGRSEYSGQPQLELFFTAKAGQRMRETTERIVAAHQQHNDRGKMGLVIDGKLVAAPVLQSTISDSLVLVEPGHGLDIDQIAASLNAGKPR